MQTARNGILEVAFGSVCLAGIYLVDDFIRNLADDRAADTEAIQTQRAKSRILIVDDEKLVADTCAEILEGAGFDTRTAYGGWPALDAVKAFQPHYLLTDVRMPDMNGVELAIAVRKMSPSTKILLFSGQAGISEFLLSGQQQGYEFQLLAKPIHPIQLIKAIKAQQD
jgi:CheY-like chemotaxis protein